MIEIQSKIVCDSCGAKQETTAQVRRVRHGDPLQVVLPSGWSEVDDSLHYCAQEVCCRVRSRHRVYNNYGVRYALPEHESSHEETQKNKPLEGSDSDTSATAWASARKI